MSSPKLPLPFKHVGLTGGIASGKTTVARLLAERYGATLIDADQLAREVVERGQPAYQQIVEHFGTGVLLPDESIDRKRLAALVFGDPIERVRLEAMIHPRVLEAARHRIERLAELPAHDRPRLVVEVVPLLYEVGLEQGFDEVWVVSCPSEQQIQRLMVRDGISPQEAQARLNAQWPIENKVDRADRVIENAAGLPELESNLAGVLQEAMLV